MKVFLSQPFHGKTDEEVMATREEAIRYLTGKYGDIEIIDNYHHNNAPEDAGRLWHLGESIKMLDKADAIHFCPGWLDTYGCWIEYLIAKRYGIKELK